MNRVILMGRLTRDPNVRHGANENIASVARYTLAVDRRFARRGDNENGQDADFISCVTFGKSAEFAENYLKQGTKIVVTGRLQTGSYISHDGQKVFTTDVIVEDQEFAESKSADSSRKNKEQQNNHANNQMMPDNAGFMNIPDDFDVELPFA